MHVKEPIADAITGTQRGTGMEQARNDKTTVTTSLVLKKKKKEKKERTKINVQHACGDGLFLACEDLEERLNDSFPICSPPPPIPSFFQRGDQLVPHNYIL